MSAPRLPPLLAFKYVPIIPSTTGNLNVRIGRTFCFFSWFLSSWLSGRRSQPCSTPRFRCRSRGRHCSVRGLIIFRISHLTLPQRATHPHVRARWFGEPTSARNNFGQDYFSRTKRMVTCTSTHHRRQLWCSVGVDVFSFLQELLQKYLVDIPPPRSPHIRGPGHPYVLSYSSRAITSHRPVISNKLRWDDQGVAILGTVPINTGVDFFRFPFHKSVHRFLRGSTATAM